MGRTSRSRAGSLSGETCAPRAPRARPRDRLRAPRLDDLTRIAAVEDCNFFQFGHSEQTIRIGRNGNLFYRNINWAGEGWDGASIRTCLPQLVNDLQRLLG